MPGPEANAEYHWLASVGSRDLAKPSTTTVPRARDTTFSPRTSPNQFAFIALYITSLYRSCGVHSIVWILAISAATTRSEEHTSELQSRLHLVCRLLLEKKKIKPSNSCQIEYTNITL